MEQLGKQTSKKAKMELVLSDVFKTDGKRKSDGHGERSLSREDTQKQGPIPSVSTKKYAESDDDEDLGIPVSFSSPAEKKVSKEKSKKKSAASKKKRSGAGGELDEKWKRFFTKYTTKLKNEKGRKQFLVRIRKHLVDESDNGICVRLKRLRKCIRAGNDDGQMIKIANQLKKYLMKK
jgi:hypothetical protein